MENLSSRLLQTISPTDSLCAETLRHNALRNSLFVWELSLGGKGALISERVVSNGINLIHSLTLNPTAQSRVMHEVANGCKSG